MPFQIQYLNRAIVGLPGPTSTQATTDSSVAFSGGLAVGFYLVSSDKVVHLKPGASGSNPSAAANNSFRLPPNQLIGISTDEAIDLAIIRGADETSNGTLWVTKMLQTAAEL